MKMKMLALAAAVFAAGVVQGAEMRSFPSGEKMEPHDFGGVTRPARLLELPWKADEIFNFTVHFDPPVDMLDDCPTLDFFLDVELPTVEGRTAITARYEGGVHLWDGMDEQPLALTGGVVRMRREIGHTPIWASWMDVRKVERMTLYFPQYNWADSNAVQRVWVSDIRVTGDDSWKGTERDAAYRAWLAWSDAYEPDLSDSSKYLDPPAEGRLATPLKLVENHEPRAQIVAPKDRYDSLALAARDLQHWIRKMTGAELPIVEKATDAQPVHIRLNDPAAQARWADDVAWLKGGADVDGWFVHTDGSDIHICSCVPNGAGMDDMAALGLPRDACPVGVFRGVIAFLENNSTILFASPNEGDVVYDESADFTVRWGEGRSRPATCGRGWHQGLAFGNDTELPLESFLMWNARTGGNIRMPHRLSGHGAVPSEMIEYFPNEDPYRVWDGEKRIPHGYFDGQVCLSAPDALARAVAHGSNTIAQLVAAGHPVVSLGFWNEDNWRVCVCEGCTKPIAGDDGTTLRSNGRTELGAMEKDEQVYRSTQYMQFANRLADGVAAAHPGVKTEIFAYLFQRPTPKCRISDNVVWTYCPLYVRWCFDKPVYHPCNHYLFDNFTSMQAKGGEMHVYDYHAIYGIEGLDALPEAAAEDFRWYASHGAKMIGSEYDADHLANPKMPIGMMNAWLFNRVGWDADRAKVEQLRRFYLRRLFREGAPAMESYCAARRAYALHLVPPDRPPPEEVKGVRALKHFRPHLDKITHPVAKRFYAQAMDAAIGEGPLVLHVPAEFPTIAEALAVARSGDTVLVEPGGYKTTVK